MKEAKGNLWTYPADVIVITTNGFVKNNGRAVMGRGCAQEARDKYRGIDKVLADKINQFGNVPHLIWENPYIISFPVKHNWWEQADLALIERSAGLLVMLSIFGIKTSTGEIDPKSFVIPQPGCGNGGRDWETEVKPILEPILDDRFTVIDFG